MSPPLVLQNEHYQIRPQSDDLVDDVAGHLALALADLHAVLSVKDILSGLVHFKLGDDNVGGVDADVDGLAVGLVSGAALDVDNVLLTVALDNLSLLSLEATAQHLHLVIDSDGDGSHLQTRTIRVRASAHTSIAEHSKNSRGVS